MGIHMMPSLYERMIKTYTETFYPDADIEVSSVDGEVSQRYLTEGTGVDWATIIAEAGNFTVDDLDTAYIFNIKADSVTDRWLILQRGIFLFDTSIIPVGATIISATLSLYGMAKTDQFSTPVAPDINVYSSAPASDDDLVDGDYDSLGSTPFCDTPISYADWNTAGYNDFVLNADGLAAISKTGATKFGVRNANYDVAAVAPGWESLKSAQIRAWTAEKGGNFRPKLVIIYRA